MSLAVCPGNSANTAAALSSTATPKTAARTPMERLFVFAIFTLLASSGGSDGVPVGDGRASG